MASAEEVRESLELSAKRVEEEATNKNIELGRGAPVKSISQMYEVFSVLSEGLRDDISPQDWGKAIKRLNDTTEVICHFFWKRSERAENNPTVEDLVLRFGLGVSSNMRTNDLLTEAAKEKLSQFQWPEN